MCSIRRRYWKNSAQKLKQAVVMSAENFIGDADPENHPYMRKLK
ncbi:hypothetical protein [Nitrosomonas sp. Nm51]|nr:hypothetical protein [Nitrosomonas sp. Nm51]